jgi:hypothetical protein
MDIQKFTQMCDTLKISGKCNEKYIQKLWKKSIYRCDKQSELLTQQVLYNRFCELVENKGKRNEDELFSIINYFIKCEKKQNLLIDFKYKTFICDIDLKKNK